MKRMNLDKEEFLKSSTYRIRLILSNELVRFGGNYKQSWSPDGLKEFYENGHTAEEVDRESYIKEVGNDKALGQVRIFRIKGGVGTKPLYLTVFKNDIQKAFEQKERLGKFYEIDYITLKLIGEI